MKRTIFIILFISGLISFIITFISESFFTFILMSGTGFITWFLYLTELGKKINKKFKYKIIHLKLLFKNPTIDCDFKAEFMIDNEIDLKDLESMFTNSSKVIQRNKSQIYFEEGNKKYNFSLDNQKMIFTIENIPVSYRTLDSFLVKKLSSINERLIKKVQSSKTDYYFTLYHNENYVHPYIYDFRENLTNNKLVYYNFEYEIKPIGRVSIDQRRTEVYTESYVNLAELMLLQL